jgi:hypothetical protein
VETLRPRAAWLFLFVAALGAWQSSYMIMIDTWTYKLHSAACYLAVAMFLPAWLIGGARGRPTNGDALYLWLLYCHRAGTGMAATLIRAQAKLGPVYHQITHLIPVRFCPKHRSAVVGRQPHGVGTGPFLSGPTCRPASGSGWKKKMARQSITWSRTWAWRRTLKWWPLT